MKLKYVTSKQATSTKKFDGKTYELVEAFKNKYVANSTAKVHRKLRGQLARVVKCDDKFFPYLLYVK